MKLSDFLVTESIHDKHLFKAVIMAGAPWAGKTTVAHKMFKWLDVKFVNSDIAFELFLKKHNLPLLISKKNKEAYEKQQEQRERAKKASKQAQKRFIEGMLPIVLDATSRDLRKLAKQRQELVDIGYDVMMVFVNVSLETAIKRQSERERKVDKDIIKNSWEEIQNNVGEYQQIFGAEHFIIIDNDKSTKENDEKMEKASIKFFKGPIKNPIGKKNIETLKRIGGKNLADLEKPE